MQGPTSRSFSSCHGLLCRTYPPHVSRCASSRALPCLINERVLVPRHRHAVFASISKQSNSASRAPCIFNIVGWGLTRRCGAESTFVSSLRHLQCLSRSYHAQAIMLVVDHLGHHRTPSGIASKLSPICASVVIASASYPAPCISVRGLEFRVNATTLASRLQGASSSATMASAAATSFAARATSNSACT